MEKHKLNTQLLNTQNSTLNQLVSPQKGQISAQKAFFDNRFIPQICPKRLPNQRLNYSFVCRQNKRPYSPAYSAVSSQHEEYYRSIQCSLLSENHNLKEHTDFLSSQIMSMFERDKKQSDLIKSWKNKCKQLETLNIELQQLLYRFTNQTLYTIKRIQNLLTLQKYREEELMLSSVSKSQQLCTQTEQTINNNLQELKTQISSILTVCSPQKVMLTPPKKQLQKDVESFRQNKKSKTHFSQCSQIHKVEVNSKSKEQKEYSFYGSSPPKISFNQANQVYNYQIN